jgi:hypothetical protein
VRGTARFIRVWGSGQLEADILSRGERLTADAALAVVLERATHLDRALESGLVGPETRVFVPGAQDSTDGAVVIGYDGSISDPGGDVQIGAQFFLQTQDYGTSEYLSLIGATLVKVVDERDFQAFLADADAAREHGSFVDFATHPLVRLCDVAGLGAAAGVDGPRLRLYVDAEGVISTSTAGAPLGQLGDDLGTLEAAWNKINGESARPCAVSLAQAVDEDVRVAALEERPWIARYHGAIAAVRNLRAREIADGRDIRVSGFGGRLAPELGDITDPWDLRQDDAPLLLWTDDAAYLYAAAAERVFQLPHSTAVQVERLLVHGSPQAAGDAADRDQVTRIHEHFSNVGVALCA